MIKCRCVLEKSFLIAGNLHDVRWEAVECPRSPGFQGHLGQSQPFKNPEKSRAAGEKHFLRPCKPTFPLWKSPFSVASPPKKSREMIKLSEVKSFYPLKRPSVADPRMFPNIYDSHNRSAATLFPASETAAAATVQRGRLSLLLFLYHIASLYMSLCIFLYLSLPYDTCLHCSLASLSTLLCGVFCSYNRKCV